VVDSRAVREGRAVRRRRECLDCERRFTTYEYIEERPLQIMKRTGEAEAYDRRKLVQSLRVATTKRPIEPDRIDQIVEDIERELDRSDTGKVESLALGEMVMARLKALDHIAYVRFASVYRRFRDITEFYDELKDLDARALRREMERYQRELPLVEDPAGAETGPEDGRGSESRP